MKVKLGEYIQEYSVRNKANEDIPVYSVTNTQGFCQDYFGKEVASKDKSTYKIVPRGYFAYNPSRINVGSVDWQRDEDQVIVSPLYNVFSVSPELNQQYLYYYLKSDFALHRIKAVATGSVRDNLKLEMLKNFPIRIPRVEEQEYIVQVLDKAKNIINLRRNELQKLDDLIKARFIELFGDPQRNPHGYKHTKLSDIATYYNGLTYKPENVATEGTIVLRSSNIQNSQLDFADTVRVDCAIKERLMVQKNDILMCSRNGSAKLVGKVALIKDIQEPMSFGAFMMIIRSHYFGYLMTYFQMDAFRQQIKTGATTTINQITGRMLDDVTIPLPPMSLVDQFATFVEQIDKSKLLSGCRLFHSWAPENRDKPKHVGAPRRKTKVLRGGRRQHAHLHH